MRHSVILGTLILSLNAAAESTAGKLWKDLQAVREKLPGIHQEFEIAQSFRRDTQSQPVRRQMAIDLSQRRWRERLVSGAGVQIRIFDGANLYSLEEGGDEYMRARRGSKPGDPMPAPYLDQEADWSKAVELDRRPCGIRGQDHTCVVLEVPLKPWAKGPPHSLTKMLKGVAQLLVDIETGAVLHFSTAEAIESRTDVFQKLVVYTLKQMSAAGGTDAALFQLPAGLREVKDFSAWSASRMRHELAGKPAPDLTLKDMNGTSWTLASLKGKTILLDFWATWCPPCRDDAPALEKLHGRYGARDLVVIGISVGEDREAVGRFLKSSRHSYPVVLSAENDLPRPFQVSALPTYVVIDREGRIAGVEEGDQGFGELRKLLKRAGLDVD